MVEFSTLAKQDNNIPVMPLEDINRSRYLQAEHIFNEGKPFTIVGYEAIKKETVILGKPAVVSEFNIRFMNGDMGILSLGYNTRHENMRDYFDAYPNGRTQLLKLAKGEAKKGQNAPWIFVSGED